MRISDWSSDVCASDLDRGRRFDDAHGTGWRLVVLDTGPDQIGPEEQVWFESIGGRVVALTDPDPQFTRWFAEHDTTFALQRPDFYLYGTAQSAAAAPTLLVHLRRHLPNGTTSRTPRTMAAPPPPSSHATTPKSPTPP